MNTAVSQKRGDGRVFVTRELGLSVSGPWAFTSYFSLSSVTRFSSVLVILSFLEDVHRRQKLTTDSFQTF